VIGACGDQERRKERVEHKTPHRVQKGGLAPSLLSFPSPALRLPLRRARLMSAARECRR